MAFKHLVYFLGLHYYVARASASTCEKGKESNCEAITAEQYIHTFPIRPPVGGGTTAEMPVEYWYDESMATYDYIAYLVQNTPNWYTTDRPTQENTGLSVQFNARYDPAFTVSPRVLGCKGGYYCPPPPCLYIELKYQLPFITTEKTRSLLGIPHCGAVLGRQYNTRLSEPIEYIVSTEASKPPWSEYFPTAAKTKGWAFVDGDEGTDVNVLPIARETIGDELILCNISGTPTILDTDVVLEMLEKYGYYKPKMVQESPVNTVCRACYVHSGFSNLWVDTLFSGNEEIRDECLKYRECCNPVANPVSDGIGYHGVDEDGEKFNHPTCKFVAQAKDIHSALCCPRPSDDSGDAPEGTLLGHQCCYDKEKMDKFYANHAERKSKCGTDRFIPINTTNSATNQIVTAKHIVAPAVSTAKFGRHFYGMYRKDVTDAIVYTQGPVVVRKPSRDEPPKLFFVAPTSVKTVADAVGSAFDISELIPDKFVPVSNGLALIIEGLTMAFSQPANTSTYRYGSVPLDWSSTKQGNHYGDCGIFVVASSVKQDSSFEETDLISFDHRVESHYMPGQGGYETNKRKVRFYERWPMEEKYMDCPHIDSYGHVDTRGITLRETVAYMSTKMVTKCVLEPVCAPLFAKLECFSATMHSMPGTALIAAGCIASAPDAIAHGPKDAPRGAATRGYLLRHHFYTADADNPFTDWSDWRHYMIGGYQTRPRIMINSASTTHGYLNKQLHQHLLFLSFYDDIIATGKTDGMNHNEALYFERRILVNDDETFDNTGFAGGNWISEGHNDAEPDKWQITGSKGQPSSTTENMPWVMTDRANLITRIFGLSFGTFTAIHVPFQHLQQLDGHYQYVRTFESMTNGNFSDAATPYLDNQQYYGLGKDQEIWGHTTLRFPISGTNEAQFRADRYVEIGTYLYCKKFKHSSVLWYQSAHYTIDANQRRGLHPGAPDSQFPTGFDGRNSPFTDDGSSSKYINPNPEADIMGVVPKYTDHRQKMKANRFTYTDTSSDSEDHYGPGVVFPKTLRHSVGCASPEGFTVTVKDSGKLVRAPRRYNPEKYCALNPQGNTGGDETRLVHGHTDEYVTYITLLKTSDIRPDGNIKTPDFNYDVSITCGKVDTIEMSYSVANESDPYAPKFMPGGAKRGSCGIGVYGCGQDVVSDVSFEKYRFKNEAYEDGYDPRFDAYKYFNMLTDITNFPSIGAGNRQGHRNRNELTGNRPARTNIQLLKGIGVSPAVLPICLNNEEAYDSYHLCEVGKPQGGWLYTQHQHTEATLTFKKLYSPEFRSFDPCLRLSKTPVVDGNTVDAGCDRTLYGCGDAHYRSGDTTLILCSSGPLHTSTTIDVGGHQYGQAKKGTCQTNNGQHFIAYMRSNDHSVNPGNYIFSDNSRIAADMDYERVVTRSADDMYITSNIYNCYTQCKSFGVIQPATSYYDPYVPQSFAVLVEKSSMGKFMDEKTSTFFDDTKSDILRQNGLCVCWEHASAQCGLHDTTKANNGIFSYTESDNKYQWYLFDMIDSNNNGYPDAMQATEFDLNPVRQIVVPKDDTHTPTYDTETFTCDCAGASPVYTCQTIVEDTDRTVKMCAWSWNRPPNGGALVGLYIGSKQGPTNIAYRNYFKTPERVNKFYGRTQPQKWTYDEYQNQEPKYVDDTDWDSSFTKEAVPGLCLRHPYGHTHPLATNTAYWNLSLKDNLKMLYTYCGKYTALKQDDVNGDFVYCSRDQMSITNRQKWCTNHKRWAIIRTGEVISDIHPACNHDKSICIFFPGHPKFPSVTILARELSPNGHIIIAPMSFRVARGFMYNTSCINILTGNKATCITDTSSDHPTLTETEWDFLGANRGADRSVRVHLTDVKDTLNMMRLRVIAFRDAHNGACPTAELPVPIPSNDGQTELETDIMCGTSDDISTLIPWNTVLKRGITITSCKRDGDNSIPIHAARMTKSDIRVFTIFTSEPVSIDVPIIVHEDDACHTVILVKANPVDLTTALISANHDHCTPLVVTDTVKSLGKVQIETKSPVAQSSHFAAAVSHFGGTFKMTCTRGANIKTTCQILVLNADADHTATFICDPGESCDIISVSDYTNMFGLAEERAVFNNPPSHRGSIWTAIIISAAISLFCVIVLYFECTKTKHLVEKRMRARDKKNA